MDNQLERAKYTKPYIALLCGAFGITFVPFVILGVFGTVLGVNDVFGFNTGWAFWPRGFFISSSFWSGGILLSLVGMTLYRRKTPFVLALICNAALIFLVGAIHSLLSSGHWS